MIKIADANKLENCNSKLIKFYNVYSTRKCAGYFNSKYYRNTYSYRGSTNKYEQLGMFKAKLDTGMYLSNVISTSGQQSNNIIKVKIEGDLP